MKSSRFIEKIKWNAALFVGKFYRAENINDGIDIEPYYQSEEWEMEKNDVPHWPNELLRIKHLHLSLKIQAIHGSSMTYEDRFGFYWIAKQLQALHNLEYLEISFYLANDISKIDYPYSPIPHILYNPNENSPFFLKLEVLVLRNMWSGKQPGTTFYCPSLRFLYIHGLKGFDNINNVPYTQNIEFEFKSLKHLVVLCTRWYAQYGIEGYDRDTKEKILINDTKIESIHYDGVEPMSSHSFVSQKPFFPLSSKLFFVDLRNLPPMKNVLINAKQLYVQNTSITFSKRQPRLEKLTLYDNKSIVPRYSELENTSITFPKQRPEFDLEFLDATKPEVEFPPCETLDIPKGVFDNETINMFHTLLNEGRIFTITEHENDPLLSPKYWGKQPTPRPSTRTIELNRQKMEHDMIMNNLTDKENGWIKEWPHYINDVIDGTNPPPTDDLKALIKNPYYIETHEWKYRKPTGQLHQKRKFILKLKPPYEGFIDHIKKLTLYLEIEIMPQIERIKSNGYIYDIALMLEMMLMLKDLTINFIYSDNRSSSDMISPCLNIDYIFNPERTSFKFLQLESLTLLNVINTCTPERMYAAKFQSLKNLEMSGCNDLPHNLKGPVSSLTSSIFDSGSTTLKLIFTEYFTIRGELDIKRFNETDLIGSPVSSKQWTGLELHTKTIQNTNSVSLEGNIFVNVTGYLDTLYLKGSAILVPPNSFDPTGKIENLFLIKYKIGQFVPPKDIFEKYRIKTITYDIPQSLVPFGTDTINELEKRGMKIRAIQELIRQQKTPIRTTSGIRRHIKDY